MPAWSPDGEWIYFVRTRPDRGRWRIDGQVRTFEMNVPALMRMHPDGGGVETVLDGLIEDGANSWFFWIRQPAPSPDGQSVALISDGPDPSQSDVVLQILDLATGELRPANAPQPSPLGHQDPAWRPDGKFVAHTKNGRDGARGAPVIARYEPARDATATVTGPGYLSPSWSPDSKYLAVTRTSLVGTDIVIVDGATGSELLRLTDDGRSWSPAWSPAGDAVAYLHRSGDIVDLRLVQLDGRAPDWRVEQVLDLTVLSGLDGSSRPTWWIPPDELPAQPTPAPSGSAASPSASPGS
jgi:Tol biopolymer transport system component